MPAIDLHHLAIKTDDVDATVEFWNNVIGSHCPTSAPMEQTSGIS